MPNSIRLTGPHPEATAHWANVADKHTTVHDFMAWLSARGIELDFTNVPVTTPLSLRVLINEFFEVNYSQLEEQRRWLLAQQRKLIGEPDDQDAEA